MRRPGAVALAAAIGVAHGGFAAAQSMTKADYAAARKIVLSDFRTARIGCEPMTGSTHEICMADVTGREGMRLAELEELYQPGPDARAAMRVAKAQVAYSLAIGKCREVDAKVREACLAAARRPDGKS